MLASKVWALCLCSVAVGMVGAAAGAVGAAAGAVGAAAGAVGAAAGAVGAHDNDNYTQADAAGRHRVYERYSVESVVVRSEDDKQLLLQLEQELQLDWWSGGAVTAGGAPPAAPALFMVAPQRRDELLLRLDGANLTHALHIHDVASAFREFDESLEHHRSVAAARMERLQPYQDYISHEEVNEYLQQLAQQHPDIVTLVDAGVSYEGRSIQYLKLSTSGFTDVNKPVIMFQSLIHAREWLTTPTVLYAADRLLRGDDDDRALLLQADFILLPVVNPDGYEWSRSNIRLWRKTRSQSVDPGCLGVDGNRNYDYNFGTLSTSVYHCSDTWPGERAFSEPETRVSRDIVTEHAAQGTQRMELFVDVHSHGSWVLYGHGDRSLPPNAALLHACAANMAAAMDARKLPEAAYYTPGNSARLLYPTSGTAQDYAGSVGVPLTFTVELPNYGRDFRVPPEYLPHVTAETWAGLSAAARIAVLTYADRRRA